MNADDNRETFLKHVQSMTGWVSLTLLLLELSILLYFAVRGDLFWTALAAVFIFQHVRNIRQQGQRMGRRT